MIGSFVGFQLEALHFVSFSSPLAVVPIVVNAGAALLPAILAGFVSFVAILFKPKEMFRVFKAKPWIPLLAFMFVGITTAAFFLWPAADHQEPSGRRAATATNSPTTTGGGTVVHIDWTQIALARINSPRQSSLNIGAPTPTQSPANIAAIAVDSNVSTGQPFVFRGGPARLGSIGESVTGSLQKAWQYYPRWTDESGAEQEDMDAMILSSPAYHGDRVYGASCLLDPPYSYGAIFCLDANTGEQIWSVGKLDGEDLKGFFSSPALTADGRYLLIGQGLHPDSDCNLICIDTERGEIHWTLQVSLHIESSPAIDGDTVYVGCGAIEDPTTHKPLSHAGFVLAANIADGKELWRYDVADPESSPIVEDGVLYIGSGFNGQAVVALDTKPDSKDRLLWKTSTSYPITGATTLMDDLVIVGGGNGDFVYRDPNPAGVVLALEKKTGAVRWSTELPDAVLGAVAAGSSLICPVANGQVIALDPSDGKQIWATEISGHAPVLAACSIADGSVFAVSQDGYLGKLALKSGKLLERTYINSADRPGAQGLSISSPFIAHGKLFVGSETGGLRCYQGDNTP